MSFSHHFGTGGHHFGITGHHCGTLWQEVAVWAAHVSNLSYFRLVCGPCGLPFFTIGITILFPGDWNGEDFPFCGQLDSRLDFGTKSDEVLRCLGW